MSYAPLVQAETERQAVHGYLRRFKPPTAERLILLAMIGLPDSTAPSIAKIVGLAGSTTNNHLRDLYRLGLVRCDGGWYRLDAAKIQELTQ